jgi:hypothetical protein
MIFPKFRNLESTGLIHSELTSHAGKPDDGLDANTDST